MNKLQKEKEMIFAWLSRYYYASTQKSVLTKTMCVQRKLQSKQESRATVTDVDMMLDWYKSIFL